MAFWCIGFLIFASGKNITTLAGGQFFQSFGSTGNQILLQVFIADTSDLLNRALWSTLPDIPFLFTVWLGPLLADTFTKKNWRLGYYIWAPIIPFSFLPLGISMFINQKKAVKKGLIEPSTWRSKFQRENLTKMLRDMDPVGIFLLVAGLSLLLVPITLAASVTSATLSSSGWKSPAILVPIVLGCLCLFAFPFWETKASSVPFPLVPLHLFKNRTVTCGCILGFFYFMAFYLSVQPFFATYLQVVHFQSITGAGRIVSIFSFSCTISALITSQLIKASARYKCFIIFGTLLYTLGYGLMIKYRVENSSVGSIIANQILIGVGGGLINVPVQLGMQASVPHQNVAAVTAMFLVSIEVGGAVGAAISGALWSGRLTPNLIKYLPADKAELAPLIAGSYLEGLIFEKGSPERIAINRAYDDTLHTMLIAAICMTIPLLPLACVMRNIHLDEVNQHVKGRVIGGVVDATGAKVADGNKWTRWTEHTYWKGTTMLWDYINFWDRPYQNWKNRRAAKRRAGSIFEIQPAVPNNLSPGDSPTEKPVDEGREVVN